MVGWAPGISLLLAASLCACGARSGLAAYEEAGGAGADGQGGGAAPPLSGICGNGVVEADEACDAAVGGACDADCTGRQTRTLATASAQVVAMRGSTPRTWGTNFFGTFDEPPIPNVVVWPVDLAFVDVVEPSIAFAACLLDISGAVRCAGPNTFGQLGVPPTGGEPVFTYGPVPVPASTQVAMGGQHACALAAGGVVYCWGSSTSAEIDGTMGPSSMPPTMLPLNDIVELGVSDIGSCARHRSGTVSCWGGGVTGIRVMPLEPALELTSGLSSACARLAGGRVACWDANDGESVPSVVDGVAGLVRLGTPSAAHACGVDGTATGICWGGNGFAELGRGQQSLGPQSPGPVTVVTGVREIAAAPSFTCARLLDDRVACWGQNQNGVLGFDDGAFPSAVYPQAQFIVGFP